MLKLRLKAPNKGSGNWTKPVIAKCVAFCLWMQRTSCRKHHSSVQVPYYSLYRARCIDAGLSSTWALLESREEMRNLTSKMIKYEIK